ncbi:MAG: hypothetical protein WCB19_02490 [Thermoplasmata archaeon]
MDVPAPPEEWVPAEDSLRWNVAYFLAYFAVLYLTITGSQFLVSDLVGGARPTLEGLLVQLAIALPVVVLFAILFMLHVPRPLPRVSISPLGLELFLPFRTIRVPWSRVSLIGDRVYAYSRRGTMTHAFRANPYQSSRLALFAPKPA